MIKKFLEDHQTIASILTIIISVVAINGWQVSDIRQDIKETNKRIDGYMQESNQRIDGLFQFVLTGKTLEKK